MPGRVDSASKLIMASSAAVYAAFATPGAIEHWLPPSGMTGKMLHFDFREGGSYRMRLTYADAQPSQGKTSQDSDEVEVCLTRLVDSKSIEQEVTFDSDDPAFSGIMRMIWSFAAEADGTRVTVRAENVPDGIRPEDHQVGLNSSLESLAAFLKAAG